MMHIGATYWRDVREPLPPYRIYFKAASVNEYEKVSVTDIKISSSLGNVYNTDGWCYEMFFEEDDSEQITIYPDLSISTSRAHLTSENGKMYRSGNSKWDYANNIDNSDSYGWAVFDFKPEEKESITIEVTATLCLLDGTTKSKGMTYYLKPQKYWSIGRMIGDDV